MSGKKRDVFFLTQSQTDGIILSQDGLAQYVEVSPGLRRTLPPLPGKMTDTVWKALEYLRDVDGTVWNQVEDNDRPGIFCRFSNQFFELDKRGQDMRVLLNLVMDLVQLDERVIFFQMLLWDGEKEWGHLLMNDGRVMRFSLDGVGNTMNQKWSVAQEVHFVGMEDLLRLVRETSDVARRGATGHFSSRGKNGKRTLLISYLTGEPFIIHTEGPLEWIHENEAKECHSLFNQFLKLSQKL